MPEHSSEAAIHSIEDEFSPVGIMKAGELLVRPATALEMLARIEQLGLQVVAVHVWKAHQGGLAESLDYLDLTAGSNRRPQVACARESVAEAREFVTGRLSEGTAYISIIVADPRAA